MTLKEAEAACSNGSRVTDGTTTGKAIRIVFLYGKEHISTDAPGKKNNIDIKKARLA